MYNGYLESFHNRYPVSANLSYIDHLNLLLTDTTEFAGSYNKWFKKLGIDANCIITNDILLQNKWRLENGKRFPGKENILYKQIIKDQPEILWIEDLKYINSNWLKCVKKEINSVKLIVAYHCSPYNKSILDKLKCVDFVITCTPGLKQSLEKEGIKSYLVYHGFDKDLLSRIDNQNNIQHKNLVFSGSLTTGGDLHGFRISMIENILKERLDLALYVNLEKEYKIKLKQTIYLLSSFLKKLKMERITENMSIFEYGRSQVKNYSDRLLKSNNYPLFGIDMYNLFNISKTVLNIHVGIAGDYAGNMRLFEVTGVGSCLLTDNKRNIGELFDINNEIVVYTSIEDCIEKAKWLTEHEDERKKIALNGHKRTLSSHTVEDRCNLIIDIIKSELNRV